MDNLEKEETEAEGWFSHTPKVEVFSHTPEAETEAEGRGRGRDGGDGGRGVFSHTEGGVFSHTPEAEVEAETEAEGRGKDAHFFSSPSHIVASLSSSKRHMEEEITSGSRLVELNEHNSDNKMMDTVDLKNNELNEDNVENEKEETRKVEDKVEDPCVGMLFGSIDDIMEYFIKYACNRAGKQKIKASNSLKAQPQSKTGCKAHFNMIRCLNGWILKSMELDHNHGLSPGKTRFYKCNRVLKPHVKRQLELNAKAGIKMNKNFNSLVVEAGGHENLPFLEKDCRNHMDKVKRLELGEGDAVAMNKYFLKMQADNSNFFYMMDFTEDGRLKNVFWADARSREAFKEFGDVVTFDTTYLVNKYSMPFAPFVGVNHHGQSILLGCGLISGEDTDTFR
ncbi:hypothetical protein SO802_020771 [Lithocarpus litseifolius]|uniref:Protein FAR1-RELATED SEQUENCE n=1 Tax=Lithocarpus litseifolius TaxID=425828 RepID=A0AAW2CGG1_9ROSI